jgi:hypothetical protein
LKTQGNIMWRPTIPPPNHTTKIMNLRTLLPLLAGALWVAGCAHHHQHATHAHVHGPNCGHVAVTHDGHTDYLDNGHLHHVHAGHVDEHTLAVGPANPAACTPGHQCAAHAGAHTHSATCGHARVPHGDHTDYLVDGHLHHPHGGHCDVHGAVTLAK